MMISDIIDGNTTYFLLILSVVVKKQLRKRYLFDNRKLGYPQNQSADKIESNPTPIALLLTLVRDYCQVTWYLYTFVWNSVTQFIISLRRVQDQYRQSTQLIPHEALAV